MPERPKIPPELRARVRLRAHSRCEYCHASEEWQYVEFTMEHIVPIAVGGKTAPENLALCCFSCNRRKWDRRTGLDPTAGREHRLFNPREDAWNDHFAWASDGLSIVGQTAVGRATVAALDLNRERVRQIRAADATLGRHPPPEDRRISG